MCKILSIGFSKQFLRDQTRYWVDLLWKIFFVISLSLWGESCFTFSRILLERLPRRHSTCPNIFFWRRMLFVWRNSRNFTFFGFSAESFGFMAEKINRVAKTEFYVPGWTFWRKLWIEIKTFVHRFRTSSKKFRTFSEALLAGLSNFQPTFPEERFGEV